ncbi:MAG: hypothetical protein P1U32_05300 [Legionellaceae bacterium]|nr:hypothetical protein [Legionellaceae bacterium]
MTPDEIAHMIDELQIRKDKQEALLVALNAPDVDIDTIVDNRDKSPNWIRSKPAESRHREELFLRADISRLDKQIDARIKALHAQKNHVALDEPATQENVDQVVETLKKTNRELETFLEQLNAPDVNIDRVVDKRDRSPQRVHSKREDPQYHDELMLRRDISQLNQAIDAKLPELIAVRNKVYVEQVNAKYDALLEERDIIKQRLAEDSPPFTATELEQRSALRNRQTKLSTEINTQKYWMDYFNDLTQAIEKREAYLDKVEALSSLEGDRVPAKPEPFKTKGFFRDKEAYPVNDALVAKLATLDQAIDARARLLTSPMRGGSPQEVRDNTAKTRQFFEGVDKHFALFRTELSKNLAENPIALEDILSELNGLQAALSHHKVNYLNALKAPVKPGDDQSPPSYADFYRQCADTLNKFMPALSDKAALAAPDEKQEVTRGLFSGLLKWFADAWAATFSAKPSEPVSARTTDKEARSAAISRQFKGKVQDFIAEQENKSPNQGHEGPEATSADDITPQQ